MRRVVAAATVALAPLRDIGRPPMTRDYLVTPVT